MEWVETALGRVPVWGSWASDRPLILGIRGAFAERNDLADLDPPGCDLALLHLPGFYSPPLLSTSIGAFIAAFDKVIAKLFSGRELTVVGLSVGAIVALGLRASEVRAVLAVEPFFSTAKLWPMVHFVRRVLQDDEVLPRAFASDIFGISPLGITERDYSAVLARSDRPVLAVAGDVPLNPPRNTQGMPSLMDESDRARLPCRVVSGGHGIPVSAIRDSLRYLEGPHWQSRVTGDPPAPETAIANPSQRR